MDAPSLSLPRVFFPEALIDKLADKDHLTKKERLPDEDKIAFITLLMSNVEESLRAFKERRLAAFDALVGDQGCERQALNILDLATSKTFEAETNKLQEEAKRVNEVMKDYLLCRNVKNEVKNLFNHEIDTIRISKEMAYLLQCHLLTFTKMSDAESDKTESKLLDKLVKGGTLSNTNKNRIVDFVKVQLSERSIEFLRDKAHKIVSIPRDQANQLCSTLNTVRRHNGIAFACQFYSIKAVVCCLRERERSLSSRSGSGRATVSRSPLFFIARERMALLCAYPKRK